MAFAIALIIHIGSFIFLFDNNSVPLYLPEFWTFFVTDIALWTVGLLPLLAAWHRQLAWYDPFFWLALLCFGTFAGTFLALIVDGEGTLDWLTTGYGGYIFSGVSVGQMLLRLAEAEIIILIFLAIITFMNRRPIDYGQPVRGSRRTYVAALSAAAVGLTAGFYGFARTWSVRSYLEILAQNLGAVSFALGEGRWVTLQKLAFGWAVPFVFIGWMGLREQVGQRHQARLGWIALTVSGLAVFPLLYIGARSMLALSVITSMVVLRYFGIFFTRRMFLVMGIMGASVIAAITVLRGNPLAGGSLNTVMRDLLFGDLFQSFLYRRNAPVAPLLDLDRVASIAVILEYLRGSAPYLYGESLVAGIFNFGAELLSRFSGGGHLLLPVLRVANSYTYLWRFGTTAIGGGALPPSYAGEFFMQWGYASLILLSSLFGWLMFRLRTSIAASPSVLGRWILIAVTMTLTQNVTAEISEAASALLLYIPAMAVLYGVMYFLSGRSAPVSPVVPTDFAASDST